MIRRIAFSVIMLILAFAAQSIGAQQLRVLDFVRDPSDLSASVRVRDDLNNDPCALVKVAIASPSAKFSGDIMPPAPKYRMGQYWVYMPANSRRLQIYVPGYLPLTIDFFDYPGIEALTPCVTYKMTIEMPGADPNLIGRYGCAPSAPQEPCWSKLSHLEPFALACVRDGEYYYFSESNWKKIPDKEKVWFAPKGVVVVDNGECFILDLHDSGYRMTWYEAMEHYGDRLPTKDQAQMIAKHCRRLNDAIIAFGGNEYSGLRYWTRTESNSSAAWTLSMINGNVISNYKFSTHAVRAVAPLQDEPVW